ncbi:MAG: hypothetical protein EOP10_13610 [Proteobacteria bacterium]|nr:MAG: hypothetical protein EOP10_13610 [Pseudomonadota bacterium]
MNRITWIAAAGLLCAASAANAASADENRLIGAWQEGKTGAMMVYKADHRFELHPPCGPKQDDLRRVGLPFVPGTWELSDAGELIVTISAKKRSFVTEGKLQWTGGQMNWIGKDGRMLQRAGKYKGPLPPAC